jgi:hypothetical protein
MNKRKNHAPAFKAQVALTALCGGDMFPPCPELSIHEVTAEHIAYIVLSRQGRPPT